MITNQVSLRKAFWAENPSLIKRRHRYSWNGKGGELDHHVDTRVTWVNWLDRMHQDGQISTELMNRAQLSRN